MDTGRLGIDTDVLGRRREARPDHPGTPPRLRARQLGASEADLLRSYPSLRAEDLANAWAYARAHREEIERQILDNEAA